MSRQRGAVLVVVLWTVALASALVYGLAADIRLGAVTARNFRSQAIQWSDTLAAVERAKMELLLVRMPEPVETGEGRGSLDERNPAYRFDGAPLRLYYPAPDGVTVRIFDHAGRINLRLITREQFRLLLEQRIEEPRRVQELLDAWEDWVDPDDAKKVNGAEREYYQSLDPPYEPRNRPFETAREILLVRGFAEVFEDIDVESVFTVHGNHRRVNPNLATRETLELLPGLPREVVDEIVRQRQARDFRAMADFAGLLRPEELGRFRQWISFGTSNYYTIAVHPSGPADEKAEDDGSVPIADSESAPIYAYTELVRVDGFRMVPTTLQTDPFSRLPPLH